MDTRPRILVCAPSDTAVDLLVLNVAKICLAEKNHDDDSRFNCGLYNIVRLGNNMHKKCLQYQLKTKVDKQMQQGKNGENVDAEKMRKEISNCQKALQRAELHCGNLKINHKASQIELKQAEEEREHLHKQLKDLKKKEDEIHVSVSSKSRQESVLQHADVVFCTLNASGFNHLDLLYTNKQPNFKYVIVDEACQCTEVDTLIPLKFKGLKLLLVGDPHQLQATVVSEKAKELGFQQSMFERMYKYFKTLNLPVNPVHLLRTQYRMHPEICSFPSKYFYNNELETYLPVETIYNSFPFKPYLVFDIIEDGGQTVDKDITNEAESEMVLALVSLLVTFDKLSIGIITPCKQQNILLEDKFKRFGVNIGEKIEVSTVDGFQGQGKDVIILSCVGARGSSIGFVADCNRMNVALTRAKMALYIVGHFKTLQMNEDWRKLLVDAKKRKRIHVVHTGQYEAAAELCRKDQGSHNSENRIEFESRPVKEAIGPGRKPCKEVNRQEKVSRKKMTPDEGTRDKSQDLGIEAKQHRQPFETESRDHGRVIDKDNVPNKTASNGQHNERLANLPHAGHTQEDSHMERSGEGYSSVGSEDYGMESLEEGEIREEPIPSTNRSKRSKKGKKSYKDLAAVTESLRLKYPPGPLLKVISHLPSNPNEHRKKQGRSGKQKKTPQNQKHKQSRTRKEKHKSSRSSETQKVGMQQCKGHSSSRTNEEKSGQKRKRHIHDDNLEPNQKRKPGHRKKEPPQKHTRRSSSANGEPNSRQQHRRDVNNDNQEQQNSQTDRHSPSTSTTLTPQPKEQRLHHGKKRVAHKPRQQSTEHTSSDLESTSSRPPANEIPNGCSVQSEASHSNTVHPPGSSSRSGHTRSILSSPSRPKSKSVRRIRISSALPEVHIVERYIVNQPSSE
ncbi:helicase sen1-like isoform X2 [Anneissia japonica]|uniref:helicase sen1-like isoform X2 n=1 Tax=Anneissia japonica TaxID=1529436 RepID=UPI00142573C2|nr:helicase sen1-like isoform X2 [Anneissia japonica]